MPRPPMGERRIAPRLRKDKDKDEDEMPTVAVQREGKAFHLPQTPQGVEELKTAETVVVRSEDGSEQSFLREPGTQIKKLMRFLDLDGKKIDELTAWEIQAAADAKKATIDMTDEDATRMVGIVEERAARLINLTEEELATDQAPIEVQVQDSETPSELAKRRAEAPIQIDAVNKIIAKVEQQTDPAASRKKELLTEMGLPGNASARQIVDKAKEIAENEAKMTGESIQAVAARVNEKARELISLQNQVRYIPQPIAKEYALYKNETPEQLDGGVFEAWEESEEPTAVVEQNATEKKQAVATPEEAQPTAEKKAVSEITGSDAEIEAEFLAIQETLKALEAQLDDWQQRAELLQQKEQKQERTLKNLFGLLRRKDAPKPQRAEYDTKHLAQTEATIAEAEAAIAEIKEEMALLTNDAERIAKRLVRNVTRSIQEMPFTHTPQVEGGIADLQQLHVEELQQRHDEAINELYRLAGQEKPKREHWKREIARALGIEQNVESMLPNKTSSRTELQRVIVRALEKEEGALEKNAAIASIAKSRRADLEAQLASQGIDLNMPGIQDAIADVEKQYAREEVNSRLGQTEARLQNQKDQVRAYELATMRRQYLDGLGLQSAYMSEQPLTLEQLESLRDNAGADIEDIFRLISVEDEIARIQQRLQPSMSIERQARRDLRQRYEAVQAAREERKREAMQLWLEGLQRARKQANIEADKRMQELPTQTIAAIQEKVYSTQRLSEIEGGMQAWDSRIHSSKKIQEAISAINSVLEQEGVSYSNNDADRANVMGRVENIGGSLNGITSSMNALAEALAWMVQEPENRTQASKTVAALKAELLNIYSEIENRSTQKAAA